jgi:hypothetical protein
MLSPLSPESIIVVSMIASNIDNKKDNKRKIDQGVVGICCALLASYSLCIMAIIVLITIGIIATYFSSIIIYKHNNYLKTTSITTTIETQVVFCGKGGCHNCITFNIYSHYNVSNNPQVCLTVLDTICDVNNIQNIRNIYVTNGTLNFYYDPKNPSTGEFDINYSSDDIFGMVVFVFCYVSIIIIFLCMICGGISTICLCIFEPIFMKFTEKKDANKPNDEPQNLKSQTEEIHGIELETINDLYTQPLNSE